MHGLIYIINKKGRTFNEICTAENTYCEEQKRGLRPHVTAVPDLF